MENKIKTDKKTGNMPDRVRFPHDRLVKAVLGRKKAALDFLKLRMPTIWKEQVDLETLNLESSSFVSEALKETRGDLVYSVKFKDGKGRLYVLIEHQSEYRKDMPLRLLEYEIRLMRAHLAQKRGKKFPCVISLVLYNGEKKYVGSKRLEDAFERPDMLKHMLSIFTIDLSEEPEEKMLQGGESVPLELILKQGKDGEFCNYLRERRELIGPLLDKSPAADEFVMYMLARDPHGVEEVLKELPKLAPNKKEKIMTALQQIRQEGIQLGEQRERQKIMDNLIKQGVDRSIIRKALKN